MTRNTLPSSPNRRTKMRCVDLFAGAGGLSLAAKDARHQVVAAVERDEHACATYKKNLMKGRSKTRLYSDDILELSPQTLKRRHFSSGTQCDLLLGGPPCQGFSAHRIKDAGVGDPRNKLVLRYFEFVKVLRPKAFLMENVPGILWPRHKSFLAALRREAKRAGYTMYEPVVLDARDYGVPQRRKRVFVLGVRSDIQLKSPWPPLPTHGSKQDVKANSALQPWVPAREVFKKVRSDDPNNIHMNHSPEMIKVFRSTPANGGSRHQSSRVLPCHADHDGHKDVYGRIDPRQPGPTMTTACVNPSKGRFVHPVANHGISVRHAARFQTFPDWFEFEGGLTAAARQIGNAVPVLLGKVLLTFLAKNMTANRKRKGQSTSTLSREKIKRRRIAQTLPLQRRA
jgi:DNA (cytosine-5)-methyltransferase 1